MNMISSPEVRSAPVRLVKQVISRRNVQMDLISRGFSAFRYGTNVYILNHLTVDQYNKFLNFLDVIKRHINGNYEGREDETTPLTLPWQAALRKVNFDKLMENNEAMAKVFDLCVFPKGRTKVDLTLLPWVYKEYVAKK